MAPHNGITVPQLDRLIGTPDCPDLFDICLEDDFGADPFLIPGARRHPYTDIAGIRARLTPGRRAVIICQKGRKLSQGVAAWLAGDGIHAEYLEGGVQAWRDTKDAMRVPASALPPANDGHTIWVTRHRPKIDRIACPWLIRRFVDPKARFLFVSPSEVSDVADRFGATAFDVEGVFWTHRGDTCTFDTMCAEFHLTSDALARLALVVRGADINRHDLHPAAAGLLAVSAGLSRQFRNDHEQLQAGLAIYDALYRWARDGYDEGHDWPVTRNAR
ncbi:Chromate resistance exported protein [Roseovarius sp. THAF9]|uniref:chromate resistance protein ChrB domain-containing protein n=1 Tax=Roseovarius sp. THAF9 TaxID=2587847 RepID=UPI00126957A3|nr:sulfurtransferase/chromate resistance protein [Roseovarius sp. THAF9]QFT92852.1 Chromate resistance exported protein [Roseovarius sp. THAF9]